MLNRLLSIVNDILFVLPITIISLTIHEYAHGYIAYKLGDPTAKESGRLTLNPLAHIDPIGFIIMLVLRFGWAKPVPVNPLYFRNPKKGMMLTAAAGPLSNLTLAIISTFFSIFFLYSYTLSEFAFFIYAYKFFYIMAFINFGLAAFNLIPVHPFDGSRILGYFMPNSVNNFTAQYGNYIYIAFFVFIMLTDYVSIGISYVQSFFYNVFGIILRYPAIFLANLIF